MNNGIKEKDKAEIDNYLDQAQKAAQTDDIAAVYQFAESILGKRQIEDQPTTEIRSIIDFQESSKDDPNELFKDRYLCKKGSILFAGPTGIGKSVFLIDCATKWATGLPAFGITPKKKLKTLIVQAENDDGDIAEMRDGAIHETLKEAKFLDESSIKEILKKGLCVVQEMESAGASFARKLDAYLSEKEFDLVIIDPAFSYLGGDANSSQNVSTWLRNNINPILSKHNVGLILVHHTNKQKRDEKDALADSYLASGSNEWANWARGIIVLKKVTGSDYYELIAAKEVNA